MRAHLPLSLKFARCMAAQSLWAGFLYSQLGSKGDSVRESRVISARLQSVVLALSLALLIILSVTVRAQSQGGEFVLEKSTIDAGGLTSNGGAFEVTGTIAQPEARLGPASGGPFQVYGGYWPRSQADFLFNDGFEG